MDSRLATLQRLRTVISKLKTVYSASIIVRNESGEFIEELNRVEVDLAEIIDTYMAKEYSDHNIRNEQKAEEKPPRWSFQKK